jgi:hypothetical protein
VNATTPPEPAVPILAHEEFYRLALTEPKTAVESLQPFSSLEQAMLVTNLYMNMVWLSFGRRSPTWRTRRRAAKALAADIGRAHYREIKALLDIFDHPDKVFAVPTATHANELMVHMAAAIYARAEPDGATLQVIIERLLTPGLEHLMSTTRLSGSA